MPVLTPPGQSFLLTSPTGLRRFRGALGDAFNTFVPIICVGDSLTFGQGSDNVNATNAIDYQWGYPAQLRKLFGAMYGTGGEGFLFTGPATAAPDTRITVASALGSSTTVGPFANQYQIGTGGSVTLAVPATDAQGTAIASVDIILWYQASGGNQPPTYNFNSGGVTGTCGVGAGSGTTDTYYTGATISTGGTAANLVVSGPATAQAYVCGFLLRSATSLTGVRVHRIGLCGGTTGQLVGTSTGLTTPQQDRIIRGLYQWSSRVDTGCGTTNASTTLTDPCACTGDVGKPVYGPNIPPGTTISSVTAGVSAVLSIAATGTASNQSMTIGTPGLMIVAMGTNDYAFEGGGGTSAQNGITPTVYKANVQQLITRLTGDGWCVLLVGEPRTPNAGSGTHSENTYYSQLANLALTNDHVSYLDLGTIWGPHTASHASDMLLQHPGSIHPTRRGYGDMARLLYTAIMGHGVGGVASLSSA